MKLNSVSTQITPNQYSQKHTVTHKSTTKSKTGKSPKMLIDIDMGCTQEN